MPCGNRLQWWSNTRVAADNKRLLQAVAREPRRASVPRRVGGLRAGGQRDVRPADANLIYTSQPIFSAAIAALLLGETLTPHGLVGGGIIIVALLVSIAPSISA